MLTPPMIRRSSVWSLLFALVRQGRGRKVESIGGVKFLVVHDSGLLLYGC